MAPAVRVTLADSGGSCTMRARLAGDQVDWAGTLSDAARGILGVGAGAFVYERVGRDVWTMRRNLASGETRLLLIAALQEG